MPKKLNRAGKMQPYMPKAHPKAESILLGSQTWSEWLRKRLNQAAKNE